MPFGKVDTGMTTVLLLYGNAWPFESFWLHGRIHWDATGTGATLLVVNGMGPLGAGQTAYKRQILRSIASFYSNGIMLNHWSFYNESALRAMALSLLNTSVANAVTN